MSASKIEEWMWIPVCAGTLLSCADSGGTADATATLTRDELLNPETCQGCHPSHYREWASSMHAYAANDPVFTAMNRRGQRETNGALGSFCVDCHAPMAVREGATEDGLDLDAVPRHLKGVTCYFCHNATGVGEHFNNSLTLADDTTMRGSIPDPLRVGAHGAEYSKYHDRNAPESSLLCGSCHDIVTPAGVHLERTLKEYSDSVFSKAGGFDSCQGCHMDARPGVAASVDGAPMRSVHEHLWPGVDTALTDFPDREVQRRAIECALSSSARITAIEHDGFGGFAVRLETNAGHHQPSGAAQDRRMWLEFIAYDAAGSVLFESGKIADDEAADKPSDDPRFDRNLMVLRDYMYDVDGKPTHDFWEAAPSAEYPTGVRSLVLPAAVAPMTAHSIEARYQLPPTPAAARVTARLRIRPIDFDVLADLVASGDLAEEVLEAVPTFTVHGASVEWIAEDGGKLRSLSPSDLACPDAYRCVLTPSAPECEAD